MSQMLVFSCSKEEEEEEDENREDESSIEESSFCLKDHISVSVCFWLGFSGDKLLKIVEVVDDSWSLSLGFIVVVDKIVVVEDFLVVIFVLWVVDDFLTAKYCN